MRAIDTKKTTRQTPARQVPRKSGFGTADIRKVMFEDINRGATPIDEAVSSKLIDNSRDERRNPDF